MNMNWAAGLTRPEQLSSRDFRITNQFSLTWRWGQRRAHLLNAVGGQPISKWQIDWPEESMGTIYAFGSSGQVHNR